MGKTTVARTRKGNGPARMRRGTHPARSGLALAVCAALAGGMVLVLPQAAQATEFWVGENPAWENPGNWTCVQGGDVITSEAGRATCVPPGMTHFGVSPVIDIPEGGDSLFIQSPVIDGLQLGMGTLHSLVVGQTTASERNVLTIRNGGLLFAGSNPSAGSIMVGRDPGSFGRVVVQGEGSQLSTGEHLAIGNQGTGELVLEDGGSANAVILSVGRQGGSRGKVILAGGATLSTTKDTYVAMGGNAVGRVQVGSGSTWISGNRAIVGGSNEYGANPDGAVGDVLVTGVGSTWRIDHGGLYVGYSSGPATGTLGILDGGRVQVVETSGGAGLQLGGGSGVGTINVSGVAANGQASTFETGPGWVMIGYGNGVGTLNVDAGGQVRSALVELGVARNSDRGHGTANVSGEGSRWETGELQLGKSGDGRLNIRDGGEVASTRGVVGYSGTNGEGHALVSGAGALWDIAGELLVSRDTAKGNLSIQDGGRVEAATAVIGNDGDGRALVQGAGSQLAVDGLLGVGNYRGSGTMQVLDGGLATSADTHVGDSLRGRYALAEVRGAGARWVADGDFMVGSGSQTTTPAAFLGVGDGGRVEAATLTISGGSARVAIGGGMALDGSLLAATGAGVLDVDQVVFAYAGSRDGTLLFNHTDTDYRFDAPLGGEKGRIEHHAGHTTLTGDSAAYSGTTTVLGGTMLVDGALGGAVDVQGGSFGGTGTAGVVSIDDGGTLTPGGASAGKLTLASLALSDQSQLHFDLGTAGVAGGKDNDLVKVTGDLVLDGQLHIDATPAFGNGVYRLFDYGGTLTDNTLAFASIGGGANHAGAGFDVQTAIGGQVNLVVGGIATPIQFWRGGAGTWHAGSANWTDANGTGDDAWSSTFAVFQGKGGTVTVEGEQQVTGLQFAGNGYALVGGKNATLKLLGPQTPVRVDPGHTATLSVALTGNSALVRRDTGTLVLNGHNSYTGGTQLFEGVLEAGSDAALGAATGAVQFHGGTLRVGDGFESARAFAVGSEGGRLETSGSVRHTGTLTGSAPFNRVGNDAFEFAGNGSGYSGLFSAGGGHFKLSGVLGGTLDIAAGTTLSGNGRANDLRIAGRLAPGNSIGALTADGDIAFLPGSTFEVEVAANGRADLLDVAGTADIQGGTVDVIALDPHTAYDDGSRFVFLRAQGGVNGNFDKATSSSAFLDFSLGHDANTAFVKLAQVAAFPDVARSFNQQQASMALQHLRQEDDALTAYNALLMLDADGARHAFDASSGEIHAGAQQAMAAAGSAFNRTLLRQADGDGPGMWAAGVYDTAQTDADGNAAKLEHDVHGLSIGYGSGTVGDTGGWALGAAIGGTRTSANVRERASHARANAWHTGIYGRWSHAAWEMRGSLGYMNGNLDVRRSMAFGALARTASARQAMDAFGLSGELAWRLVQNKVTFAPVLTVDALHAGFDATRESGAGALDLSPQRQRHEQLDLGLGARLSGAIGQAAYELRAVYIQDVAADRSAERYATYAGSPTRFVVRGPEADSQRVQLSAGVTVPMANSVTLGLRYEGSFAGSGDAHGATASIDWRF